MSALANSQFARIRTTEVFHVEAAKVDFAIELKRLMDQQGINNARLADLLGVSRPMISKLLSGDANVTIETMAKAAFKLESHIMIKIVRNDEVAHLFKLARCGEQLRVHEKVHSKARTATQAVNWHQSANDMVDDEILPVAA
jgi:transcriptional regulator with XRE-family HTH domain